MGPKVRRCHQRRAGGSGSTAQSACCKRFEENVVDVGVVRLRCWRMYNGSVDGVGEDPHYLLVVDAKEWGD